MARWNPWRALRQRPHLRLSRTDLPDGVRGWYDPRGAILINRDLDATDRNATLAHELIHDERGGGADLPGMPDTWEAVVARDELTVDRTVAARLVPADELDDWIARQESVTPADVAAEWDVPLRIAAIALEEAWHRHWGRHA